EVLYVASPSHLRGISELTHFSPTFWAKAVDLYRAGKSGYFAQNPGSATMSRNFVAKSRTPKALTRARKLGRTRHGPQRARSANISCLFRSTLRIPSSDDSTRLERISTKAQ